MTITVRRAIRADLPALGRLGALLVRTHHEFDPKRFIDASPHTESGYGSFLASQLDEADVALFVAEENGAVIGYAFVRVEDTDYMSLRGPAGVLEDIVVEPQHRRHGAGRGLLQAALEWIKSRGAPRVVLSTAVQNNAARRLFESAGFRATMIEMTAELEDN